MSDERTRFRFECEGIDVELVGDGPFVQRMYRRIMRDIDAARQATESPDESSPASGSSGSESNREAARADESTDTDSGDAEEMLDDPVVWLIRCGDMMRRVYMIDPIHFRRSILHHCLDPEALSSLYIDRGALEEATLAELVDRERTLWAELTESAREKIAEHDPSS